MILKDLLIKEKIIKIRGENEEPFIINELGTKSRLFIDIKEASLNPEILRRIVYQLIELMNKETDIALSSFDKVGSVALGEVSIGTALSLFANKPQIIVRSGKHDRGTKSSIIGNCKGDRVVLIEDVAVTGNAIIKGVSAIREAGGICHYCIVVIDRQEGAKENCFNRDIELFSLLKKSDLGIVLEESF